VDPHTSGVERLPPPADFNNRRVVAVHLRIELGAVFGEGVIDFFASRTIFLFELGNQERPRRQLGNFVPGFRSLSRASAGAAAAAVAGAGTAASAGLRRLRIEYSFDRADEVESNTERKNLGCSPNIR
jgi:hypothetical protein